MDIQRPHSIIPGAEIDKKDSKQVARFLALTNDEAKHLRSLSVEQRHAWIRERLPTKERLARHLESEGLPELAYNARQGRYDDFDDGGEALPQNALMRDLKSRARHDLTWIVTSGEYDATKAESDAWAARQTGEVADLIQKMKPTNKESE